MNVFWRFKIRTASGRAARSSPRTSTLTVPRRRKVPGSPGRRRHGRSTRYESGASTLPSCVNDAPPSCSPPTAAGSTRTCRTGAARSTAASTPGRSPTACGSAPMSPASSTGSSIIGWPTAAGIVSGSRVRRGRRSTRRSTRARGCSPTKPRPEAPTWCGQRGARVRNTCCSAGCFVGCPQVNQWVRGSTGSPTHSAGSATCSTRPTTSVRHRYWTAPPRTHGWPRRWS